MHAHKLENQAIEIVAQALETDHPAAFESGSAMEVVGYGMTRRCADKVFAQAGFAPGQGRDEVGVVELHDCFAANEACRVYSTFDLYMVISLPSSSRTRRLDFAPLTWLTSWSKVTTTQ